jgi:UDP-N-acetylglucosamine:LPS N-acetylglucosamine transferase
MVHESAAVMIDNAELSGSRLATEIRGLLTSPQRLQDIENNARRIAILDAEERIVNLVEAAIERHRV